MSSTKKKLKAKQSPKKSSGRKNYQVIKKLRMQTERMLRDLHFVKHLDNGPSKVNEVWDKGSKAAIEEFLTTLEESINGDILSDEIQKELKKRHNDLYFEIKVENKQDKYFHPDYARAAPYRLKNSYGEINISYFEDLFVEIYRPFGVDGILLTNMAVEIIDENDQFINGTYINLTGEKETVYFDPIINKLNDEKQRALPVEMKGKIRCYIPDPYRGDDRLIQREQKISITKLVNVISIRDDWDRSWYISDVIAEDLFAIKSEVNAHGGKLIFNSTLRTWSKQMELRIRYKKGVLGQNPANQPGTSWHETARAIDINVWELNLPPTRGILAKRKDIDKKNVESDYIRKLGQHYLEQLDMFRDIAKKYGFTLAGRTWEKFSWNGGFAQTRRHGKIESIIYTRGLRYTFRFDLEETSKNFGMDQRILTSEGEITFSLPEEKVEHKIKLSKNHNRIPKRTWPKGTKPKRKEHAPQIIWTIEAEPFTSKNITFGWLKDNIARAVVSFSWNLKKGRVTRTYTVKAVGKQVEEAPMFASVKMQINPDEKNIGSPDAIPIGFRIQIESSTGTVITLNTTGVTTISSDKRNLSFEIDVRNVINKIADFDPEKAKGLKISIITEDRKICGTRYCTPAFQSKSSEKHHFQSMKNLIGPSNLRLLINQLNQHLKAFNDEIKKIPDKWKEKNPDARKVPWRVRRIPSHWKMREYKASSSIIKAAAYIGNLPSPASVKSLLEKLAKEIEEDAIKITI